MELGAVIVAAGMSSRMGEFKALKEILGQPVIVHMVHKFKQIGVKEVVIVTGNHAKALEEALQGEKGITYIFNEAYKTSDMFTSAKLGLQSIKGKYDRCFFTPVDAPAFSLMTLNRLLEAKEAKIVKPRFKGRGGHPIIIADEVISAIINYTGHEGMKGALIACGEKMVSVEVADEGILFNTNTIQEFERMKEYLEAVE